MEQHQIELARILILGFVAFAIAFLATPLLTHVLYKYNLGKRIRRDPKAPIFAKLHQHKEGTPTMGGVLVWGTMLVLISVFALLAALVPESPLTLFNFLDRGETYLPLGALIAAALIGLLDDILNIRSIGPFGGGLRMRQRLLLYTTIAALGAWWFYFKLDWNIITVPIFGETLALGIWYIPFFMLVIVATAFSVNETDGLDGLAGGVLMMAFASFSVIAYVQERFDLAVFSAVIVGALLAFLWFNIHPARFFLGDTGSMSLGITLGIIAMLTDMALVLPVIGFVLVIESASVLAQVTGRGLFGRKLFLSTPIHQHFQAIGWPEGKVVMRFWIISAIAAGLGLIIAITG
ncbi:MAG: phospho-N-acetylmuramoyl-pentapeptide-transferase [Candidatus Spechtbacterales bacterium]